MCIEKVHRKKFQSSGERLRKLLKIYIIRRSCFICLTGGETEQKMAVSFMLPDKKGFYR